MTPRPGSATKPDRRHRRLRRTPQSRAHLLGAAGAVRAPFPRLHPHSRHDLRQLSTPGDLRDDHALRCDDRRRHVDGHLRRHERRFRSLPMAPFGGSRRRCIADLTRTVLVVAWCSPLATWSASGSTTAYSALSEPSGLVLAFMWHHALISLFVKDPETAQLAGGLEGELRRRHEVLLIGAVRTHALRVHMHEGFGRRHRTCRRARSRSSRATSRRAHPAHACVRSVDKAPRNPPEKPASPTSVGMRNRWSGACTPARGARPTSGRGGGGDA
jgi:hypothetical protein